MLERERAFPETAAEPEQAVGNTRLRFEQWAQNPSCDANAISAVHNVKMAEVAVRDGLPSTFGQSPFALARGSTFERDLLRDDAKLLIEGLVEAGVLPAASAGLLDLRTRPNGGPLRNLPAAWDGTTELIRQLAVYPRTGAPAVVAGATVRIPRRVMLPEAVLILDVLAVRTDGDVPELIVGEIKTYPDRGGHTDPRSLALARAQAGVYVHALELLVSTLGLQDEVRVNRSGFLVLTKPGSNRPSVRPREELRFQAERARRGFELLERAALGLPPFADVKDDPVSAVQNAGTDYGEACWTFCDRAPKCFRVALAEGNGAVLGDDVRRFLGRITLHRAMELLDGAHARNDAERDLVERISQASRGVST